MFYTYVLHSKEHDQIYAGFTSDLKKRVKEHNDGLTPSTRRYRPWKLIYYEACLERADAERREGYLKTTQGSRMLKRRLKEFFYRTKRAV